MPFGHARSRRRTTRTLTSLYLGLSIKKGGRTREARETICQEWGWGGGRGKKAQPDFRKKTSTALSFTVNE